ncbi:S1C family serine protease [Planctomycetaceae bacterium SH139]
MRGRMNDLANSALRSLCPPWAGSRQRCDLVVLFLLCFGAVWGCGWGEFGGEQAAAQDATDEDVAGEAGVDVAAEVLRAQQQRVEAIAKATPTAVSVFVPGGAGGGSGVLISPDGYALTNFHVSSPAGTYMRCGLSDGKIYDAVIVGIDPVGDLALIRLLGRDDFPAAELADSDQLQAGDWCFVVGNPFLLAMNLEPTVTWGILSGVHRYQYPSGTLLEYADCLQTDASINPGNSGGPIYDAQGRLIGIVGRASFEKRNRVNVGVGYAISINQAKNFLGYLRSGRIVDHATLGATVVTDPDGGVRVSNILPSSDAYRRGLRYNDELLEVAGRIVQTANDVQNILGTLPKGWRIPLTFARGGERREILVRLAGVHRQDELIEKMGMALPPPPPAPPAPAPADDQPGAESEDRAQSAEEKGSKRPQGADGKPIPQQVVDLFAERRGYANYYFNQLHQQRLVDGLRRLAPAGADQPQRWIVRGLTDEATPREITLEISGHELLMRSGEQEIRLASTAERFDAVDEATPGAILPALDAWRRMLELGADKFGDVYYLGTAPFLGQRPLRDVLVGTAGELESRLIHHPDAGLLEAIELTADSSRDPAELIIIWPAAAADLPADESGDSNGPRVSPQALELRFGTDVVLRLNITAWNTEPTTEES